MFDRSLAERLDRALDGVLATTPPSGTVGAGDELRPLINTAGRLRAALAPVPVSARFETRLAERLAAPGRRLPGAAGVPRPPAWLLVTGVSSAAAVGVGVTAYAVWRGSRRAAAGRAGSR